MAPIDLRPGTHNYVTVVDGLDLGFACDYKPSARDWIVFIHGLACSRETFAAALALESLSRFSLLLVDLIGFGVSAKPDDFSHAMEEQARICEELLRRLPVSRLHVAAHSMGGAVALLLPPDRLSRLASFANLEGNLIGADCGLLSRGVAELPWDEYRSRTFPEQQRQFSGDACLRFDQTTATAVHKSAKSLLKWSESGELLARFRRLGCPRCYIWGEADREMPVLKELNPAEARMIPASGHCMMLDNPPAFYAALTEFIDATRSASR